MCGTIRSFSLELIVASLLLATHKACGFAPTTKLSHAAPLTRAPVGDHTASIFSCIVPSSTARRDVSMAFSLDALDMVITTAIFGAAVAATIKLSGESDAADLTDASSPEVAVIAPPKAADIIKEKEVAEQVAAVAAPVTEKPTPEPAPAVAREVAAPKPAAPLEKDISQLRNEVANTLEDQREKERRLREARRGREMQTPPTAAVAVEIATEIITEASEESKGGVETGKKKKNFVGKLLTKVVMPWKKWSNL